MVTILYGMLHHFYKIQWKNDSIQISLSLAPFYTMKWHLLETKKASFTM